VCDLQLWTALEVIKTVLIFIYLIVFGRKL